MLRLLGTLAIVYTLAGCGSASKDGDFSPMLEARYGATAKNAAAKDAGRDSSVSANDRFRRASLTTAEPLERKIIYNFDMQVIVKDFSDVPGKVDGIVKQFAQAYIAEAQVEGSAGQSRVGTWQFRVPQAAQREFLEKLRGIGDVMRDQSTSDDVSEEFYDLEARLRNKRETETRLLKVQQEKTGELKDILAVETEIDRVRGEIEQMQGRMERLKRLTSLTTVKLQVREIRDYNPASKEELSLGERSSSSFLSSAMALRAFGENVLLFCIALLPWLPLIVAACFVLRFGVRRMRRAVAGTKP